LLVSTIFFFCATHFPAETGSIPGVPPTSVVDSAESRDASAPMPTLPDAPAAKTSASSTSDEVYSSSADAISPVARPFPDASLKPVVERPEVSPRKKKIWYGLMAAGHGAAVFDAWSTRRAISGGYGTEGNPLLRPFSHSGAMYAATQFNPFLMDYLGRRMMTSNHTWMRRFWWVPQVAGAGVSFGAGVHNYRLVH
jgi:hypothetical protein